MLPEHLRAGMKRYVEDGILPGKFLTACLKNNLLGAVGRADDCSYAHLKEICNFLYNEIPSTMWGDTESVQNWVRACNARREEKE